LGLIHELVKDIIDLVYKGWVRQLEFTRGRENIACVYDFIGPG
jgi:hypothetical protein